MSTKLTKTFINSLKLQQTSRELTFWDDQVHGFGVRLRPSGHLSFVFFYRSRSTRRLNKVTLGTPAKLSLDLARNEARRLAGQVALGGDPAQERKVAPTNTIAETFALYQKTELAKTSPKWQRQIQRIFERHILPKLGDRPVKDLKRADIRTITDAIAKVSPSSANNLHRGVSAYLTFCLDRDFIEHHVLRGSRLPGPVKHGNRILDDREIAQVWQAIDTLPTHWKPYFRLLLLTGQRKSEMTGMTTRELDLPRQTWTIAATRTKNRIEQIVPLVPLAMTIIEGIKVPRSGLVFASPLDASRTITSHDGAIRKLRAAVPAIPYWGIHDLRRTVASGLARLGQPAEVIERVLNHSSGVSSQIHLVYNRHKYEAEKRVALNLWADHIQKLVANSMNVLDNNQDMTNWPCRSNTIPQLPTQAANGSY